MREDRRRARRSAAWTGSARGAARRRALGRGLAEGRKASPRLVELVRTVEIGALHAPIGSDRFHPDRWNLELSGFVVSAPVRDGEDAALVHGEDVIETKNGIRPELDHRAH